MNGNKHQLLAAFDNGSWKVGKELLNFFAVFEPEPLATQLFIKKTYTRYQALLYLCQIKPVLKHCKLSKHYDQDGTLTGFKNRVTSFKYKMDQFLLGTTQYVFMVSQVVQSILGAS